MAWPDKISEIVLTMVKIPFSSKVKTDNKYIKTIIAVISNEEIIIAIINIKIVRMSGYIIRYGGNIREANIRRGMPLRRVEDTLDANILINHIIYRF